MHLKIIKTEDGSTSVYNENLMESYHSTFGAINESMHVFIEAGLSKITNQDTINILEIGFGTGLNTLLTCIYSEEQCLKIKYFTIESDPIEKDIYEQMNFEECLRIKSSNNYFSNIHKASWDQTHNIHSKFRFSKLKKKLELYQPQNNYFHLIYFDAFSPEIQPEMWSISNFTKLFKSMLEDGILVTYCAKGQVRRDLEKVGFITERIPGPKGKREMLRATKP